MQLFRGKIVERTADSHILVRKPQLRLSEAPKYYMGGGNGLETHFFNALNLLFPDGERFFVKAVNDHLDRIHDARLYADAKAFAAQEGQHARQHQAFFEVLEAQGFRVLPEVARFRRFSLWTSRRLPGALRLAMTAGAEHYTATIGALALETGILEDCDPTMRALITWHAIEEIEHKSVAFDVLEATHPGYVLRILGFVIATTVIGAFTARGMVLLIGQDTMTREDRVRFRKELRRNPKLGVFKARMRRGLLAYFRPSFHPTQIDDQHLIGEYESQFQFSV